MYRHVTPDGGVYDFLIYDPDDNRPGYGTMVVTPGLAAIVGGYFDTERDAQAWLDGKRAQLIPDHRCEDSCGRLRAARS
jgi:hypothetical protein